MHKVHKSDVQLWVMNKCAHNGHWVCECSTYTDRIDAKTGKTVRYCN